MQDVPSAAELLEAVHAFLEGDIFPIVEGRAKFHTRVAMNVLKIVERELELSGDADLRERSGIEALFERSVESDESLLDLNKELAGKIREGNLSASRVELFAHLRSTLKDKLAIANPKY